MLRTGLIVLVLSFFCASGNADVVTCGGLRRSAVTLSLWSTKSLVSPNHGWGFVSVGPKSSERTATLFIENLGNSQKWQVGSLDRNGTAFWSDDSKRLFLRDEYAADDTQIRVFDVTGPRPKEIRGPDARIRAAIFGRIPHDETTLWLYYPRVCFAPNDSSTIMLLADAPLVRKRADSKGKDFRLRLTVNIVSLRVMVSGPRAPAFP